MIGKTNSFCPQLWPEASVTVESDILPGYFQVQVVGLGDSSIRECRERIRSAIQNGGYLFPMRHIVINLSPNDQKEIGIYYGISHGNFCSCRLRATGSKTF